MNDIKKGIAGLAIIAALGGGAYEGLVSDGPQDNPLPKEVVEARTANTVVIEGDSIITGDRKIPRFNARTYAEPVHYKDGKGKWKQIDPTLRPKPFLRRELSPYPYEVTSGVYDAEFPEEKEYNYKFSANGASVEYVANFDDKAVSIGIETTKSGVKEIITLIDDNAPTRLEWALTVDAEIREIDGGFGVYNSDGELGFLIQAANARDAKGKELSVSTKLARDMLIAEVDTTGAVYPITIDPSTTVNISGGTTTGYVQMQNATYLTARNETTADAVYNATVLKVGQIDSAGVHYYSIRRSFLAFPMSNAITCSACTLYVNGNTDYSTDDFNICLFGARSYKSILTTADCDQFNGWQASGAYNGTRLNNVWSSSSYNTAWNTIILNSAGRDSLVAAYKDTLWIAMVSAEDSAASAPANPEQLDFEITGAGLIPYLSYTYTIPTINLPTEFQMSPITNAKDSLYLSWSNNWSASIDSLVLFRWPDSLRIATLTKTASTARIGGLDPFTRYRWYIRADSAGIYGYSNRDSMWTAQTFKTENITIAQGHYTYRSLSNTVYDSVRAVINVDSILWGTYKLGQTKGGEAGAGKYSIRRHHDNFLMPKAANILADTLMMSGTSDSSTTDFSIVARSGLWNSTTRWVADRFTFDGWQSGMTAYTGTPLITSFSTAGFTTGATFNKLVFNQAGRDTALKHSVTGTDTLRITLLSSKDVSATAPTNAEFVSWSETSSYLKHTYAPPDTIPGSFTMTSISTDSLLASWTDRAYSEAGYALVTDAGAYLSTTDLATGGTATASTYSGGGTPSLAFDNNYAENNNWYISGYTMPVWIKYDYGGSPKVVTAYSILFNGISSRYPSDWIFQASNDTTGAWTNLDWRAAQVIADSVRSFYEFPNTAAYRWYRLYITKAGNASLVQINELDMFFTPVAAAGATSLRVGGLAVNTSYAWKLKVLGGSLHGQYSAADSCYTRAATPGKPTVTFPADSLLKFIIDVNGNPAYTEFAVQDSISGKYVDFISGALDTLKAAASWRTYANWGGAAGDTLSVGVGKEYTVRVKARSGQ